MSRKPENTFRSSVNRYLPEGLHHEKMNNAYSSGTADDWYSGNKSDLWLEYKFLPSIPKTRIIVPEELCSALQWRWINDRYTEGRTVGICIGCKEGGFLLLNKSWLNEITPTEFKNKLATRKELAEIIARITMK